MTIKCIKEQIYKQDKNVENSNKEQELQEKIYKIKVQHEAIKSIKK